MPLLFQVVMLFGGGGVDIGFDFPQRKGIDVAPEILYDPYWFTGFQVVDKTEAGHRGGPKPN